MSGFLGCGTLLVARKDNGVWGNYAEVGEATKFEITSNSELKERKSKKCDSYGQAVDSVQIPQPASVSAMVTDLNKETLAMAYFGTSLDEIITSGTVTAEAATAEIGKFIKTEQSNISDVVVSDVGATVTYVEGTDYALENSSVGLVTVLEGGSIVEGQELELSYSHADFQSDLVTGGTNSSIKLRYLLIGKNLVDNTPVRVDVWESNAAPAAGVDFLSDEFSEVELSGTANIDSIKGNPFEIRTNIT